MRGKELAAPGAFSGSRRRPYGSPSSGRTPLLTGKIAYHRLITSQTSGGAGKGGGYATGHSTFKTSLVAVRSCLSIKNGNGPAGGRLFSHVGYAEVRRNSAKARGLQYKESEKLVFAEPLSSSPPIIDGEGGGCDVVLTDITAEHRLRTRQTLHLVNILLLLPPRKTTSAYFLLFPHTINRTGIKKKQTVWFALNNKGANCTRVCKTVTKI